jgi:ElaB/YqjD/DUF883 family membrane-anchored ribosome-binding protein
MILTNKNPGYKCAEEDMEHEKSYEITGNPEQGSEGGNIIESNVRNLKEQGAEAVKQAKGIAKDRYKKTAESVGETYGKAIKYGEQNPDKAFVIGLVLGLGLGMLFGGSFGLFGGKKMYES